MKFSSKLDLSFHILPVPLYFVYNYLFPASSGIVQNGVCVDHKILAFDRDSKTEADSHFNLIDFDCDSASGVGVVGKTNRRKIPKRKTRTAMLGSSLAPLNGTLLRYLCTFVVYVQ